MIRIFSIFLSESREMFLFCDMMRQFKTLHTFKICNYVAPGLLEKSIDQTVRTVSDIRSVQ